MFTHLHVHTEYSLLDGLSRIVPLVSATKEQGMTALALTDHGGLHGVVDFYSACQEAGIKPIIGCEIYVAPGDHHERRSADKSPYHLTVLAQSNQGYHNLIRLVTKANLEGFYYKPRVDKQLLEAYGDGLVVLSGCPRSELAQLILNGEGPKAKELARWHKETFPHYYIELQRHENLPFLEQLNAGLLTVAEELDIPIVATNDLHYVRRGDAPYQDIMVCIQTNTNIHDDKRLKMSDDSYYLKSPEEMAELFHDLPEAIHSTQQIADLCDVTLDFSTLHLPEFTLPAQEGADSYLQRLCWEGFERRFGTTPPEGGRERLQYELDVVTQTRYANYFLVVWDIANFTRRSHILFGIRGSAASSLALYCLGVTEINPLQYGLVFERFLNVERKEMPDIDIDFQDDRRDEAIRYVAQKYGHDHVAQIITFGTLGAKAAIRDVGRALALPYGDVDQMARLVPTRLGVTIGDALAESSELQEAYNGDDTLRKLIDTARQLEGVVRHASTHAAGVVISKEPLSEYVPLQQPVKSDAQGATMTQYSMDPLAKLGLLKMDFLGLANLTILSLARDLARETRGVEIDIQAIPLDDKAAFDLLASGETTGLFQLESAGMRRYIKELKPGSLSDLAAMIALYRPGPMEHIGTFIEAKHERAAAKYPHPALQEILQETYGIIVYQDQVLHILRAFAGYSLGSADIVRKAMGKKIPELMAQERQRFVAGALQLGYDEHLAENIFDLIEPFAGYAFNKAHSVSYAMVAYWTAYLKANYTVEFMASVLNAYLGNTDKVISVASECARLDVALLPPDVNRSQAGFSIDTDGEGKPGIRFGLAAVKNVGASAITGFVEERRTNGPFKSLGEFIRRAGAQAGNRRVLESLIKAGALDSLGPRGRLLASVDQLINQSQRESQRQRSGQSTMFDLFGQAAPVPLGDMQLAEATEPTSTERGLWERQLLGISLSGGSLHQVAQSAPPNAILSRETLDAEATGAKVLVIGTVSTVRQSSDKNRDRIAFVTLGLFHGSVDVAVWSRAYAVTAELWREGAIIQVNGTVTRRNEQLGLRCDEAQTYILPSMEEQPQDDPPIPGPRMEPWPANGALLDLPGSPYPVEELATALGPLIAADSAPPPSQLGSEQGNSHDQTSSPVPPPGDTKALPEPVAQSNGNGRNHTYGSVDGGRRKLLVNLTESDHPEDDAYLLRQVLTLLLDFPGTDSVDLVIYSQGDRYRLEMPIITTNYCQELAERLAQLLGTQEAVTVLGATED